MGYKLFGKNSLQMFLKILFILVVVTCDLKTVCGSSKSKISLKNQLIYDDILVALHNNLHSSTCENVIQKIQETISESSNYLRLATNDEADFGTVNILIPYSWINAWGLLNISTTTRKDFTYESADIKIIANHSLSKALPWTKNVGKCGGFGESIFLSPDFLQNPQFDSKAKGRIFLHEWSKYRYGVFEEYGYYDDEVYSPCYYQNGQKFTSCLNLDLNAFDNRTEINFEECKSLINTQRDILMAQISRANSSIMFAPHLTRMDKYCSNDNHNVVSPTKQNVICNRKSVQEIMFSHPDFTQQRGNKIQPRAIKFQILIEGNRDSFYKNGYVFVIENTQAMRQFGRLKYVKQALTQFVSFGEDLKSDFAKLYTFASNGQIFGGSDNIELGNESGRFSFINKIPDLEAPIPYDESISRINLDTIFTSILNNLTDVKTRWKIVLISSSMPENVQAILPKLRERDHSISVLTFDDDRNWLAFNSIPNTESVIFVPHCQSEWGTCHGQSTNLMTDHLLSLFGSEENPRFLQKIAQTEIQGGQTNGSIVIPQNFQNVQNFLLSFSQVGNGQLREVRNPSGIICDISHLHNYQFVQTINLTSCPYMTGEWKFTLTLSELDHEEVKSYISAIIEPELNQTPDFKIDISYGQIVTELFYPEKETLPVYISLSTRLDEPIVDATVEIKMFKSDLSNSTQNIPINNFQSSILQLHDNGIYPDITGNDGIYSGFFMDFGFNNSYHTGEVRISTINDQNPPLSAKVLKELDSERGGAALLDPRMDRKCCGNRIYGTFENVQIHSKFTLALPSFKVQFTSAYSGNPDEISKPSKIGLVKRSSPESDGDLQVNFLAPGGQFSQGIVTKYETCCFTTSIKLNSSEGENSDMMRCREIPISNCLPVQSGLNQECRLDKQIIVKDFEKELEVIEQQLEFILVDCGILGLNGAGRKGDISQSLVELTLNFKAIEMSASTQTCDSISDDCLPIAVFWGLIGSIIGLLVIIIIILLCWFCRRRNGKNPDERAASISKEKKARAKANNYGDIEIIPQGQGSKKVSKSKPKHKRKGSIESVLSYPSINEVNYEPPTISRQNAQPLNAPNVHNTYTGTSINDQESRNSSNKVPPKNVFINRAYIQDSNGDMRIVAADGKLYDPTPSPNGPPPPIPNQGAKDWAKDDMKIHKMENPSPYLTTSTMPMNLNQNYSVQDSYNVNPRPGPGQDPFYPKPKDRSIKQPNEYQNHQQRFHHTLPSRHSNNNTTNGFRPTPNDELHYASVNNRFTPNRNTNSGLPGLITTIERQPYPNPNPNSFNKNKNVQQKSQKKDKKYQPPFHRMDRFPSSESESYSDAKSKTSVSSYIPPPPPMPPPSLLSAREATLKKPLKSKKSPSSASSSTSEEIDQRIRESKMKSFPSLAQGVNQISPVRFPGSAGPPIFTITKNDLVGKKLRPTSSTMSNYSTDHNENHVDLNLNQKQLQQQGNSSPISPGPPAFKPPLPPNKPKSVVNQTNSGPLPKLPPKPEGLNQTLIKMPSSVSEDEEEVDYDDDSDNWYDGDVDAFDFIPPGDSQA